MSSQPAPFVSGAQAQNAVASTSQEVEKPKKNRPKASQLRQQKLPAWQPILTATTVIPTVLLIGIVFIPIGVVLHLASESVKQHQIDYTDCTINTQCTYSFTLSEDFTSDVYFYYALENYYQNHRRYVKSRNDQQLLGNLDKTDECDPYSYDNSTQQRIAPCGAVANSMFNDTFIITSITSVVPVPFTTDGVLWSVDKDKKFKNPKIPDGGTLCDAFKGYAKPLNWRTHPCEMGGFENVDFIVWMRTAALPNFRKLWRILERKTAPYENGLPAGTYNLIVTNNYPVSSFSGRKSFIISTASWAGGKNSFLGIAYLVVGCIAVVLAVVFLGIHYKWKEMNNASTHG